MPNSSALCTSFKRELLCGIHALGTAVVRATTAVDVLRAALYTSAANIGAASTVYTTTGEAAGTGYTAGGVVVTNAVQPTTSGVVGFWTPSASIVFTTVSVTAVDCIMLYNNTQGNRAISAHQFAAQTLVAGTLTLTMPTNDASNALLQLG